MYGDDSARSRHPRTKGDRLLAPISAEAEMKIRLGEMERRWKDANSRQKASIERLMEARQDVLSLIHNKTSLNHEEVRELRRILNR